MCQCVVYTLCSCNEVVDVPVQVFICVCRFSVDCCVEVVDWTYGD